MSFNYNSYVILIYYPRDGEEVRYVSQVPEAYDSLDIQIVYVTLRIFRMALSFVLVV